MDVISQFGREAEKYLHSKTHGDQTELARFVGLVNRTGGNALDLATGAGHMAFALANVCQSVTLNDITPRMLEVAMAEGAQRGFTNLSSLQADVTDLPVADHSFDGVSCRLAAHHFPNIPEFVAEVRRVLKPGGWLLFVDTVGIEGDAHAQTQLDRFEALRDPSHVRDHLASEWRSWWELAAFTVQHEERISHRYLIEEWMDRMSVEEPARSQCRDLLINAEGAVAQYLEPQGEADSLSFLLHQTVIVADLA